MRFSISLLAATLCAVMVQAKAPNKAVLVSYPDGTDASVMDAAKQAIIDAGGEITHEFSLFNGFSAIAPAQVLEASVASVDGATVEEDQEVRIQSKPSQ